MSIPKTFFGRCQYDRDKGYFGHKEVTQRECIFETAQRSAASNLQNTNEKCLLYSAITRY
jgi:hypothetical protein